MADEITLEVARYRPGVDAEPVMQQYQVPLREHWAILDGLTYIKDQLDGTLSFRWSCRMGICGSCGMTVNGEPQLSCATFLTDYAPGPIRVEPLRNFPVIRDLVVDIDDFMTKLPTVKPWVIRDVDEPEPRAGQLGEPDGFVEACIGRGASIDGNQDALVHGHGGLLGWQRLDSAPGRDAGP